MNQRLMAIWQYDKYPFMCFGEVEKINDDGTVLAWQNNRFRPFKILPYEVGLEIQKKVEDLEEEHRIELDKLYKNSYLKLQKIFPTDHVQKMIDRAK